MVCPWTLLPNLQAPNILPGPMSNRITVAIAGGSGYVGGELLRLLLDHPAFTVTQITSERHKGSFVHFTHPQPAPTNSAQVHRVG